jgi:hypothetical protein
LARKDVDELTVNQDQTNDATSFAERRIGSTALSSHRSTFRVIAAEREDALDNDGASGGFFHLGQQLPW